jgi:deoxyribose-phosphate aldolase
MLKTSISIKVSGGDFGLVVGIDHYIMIQDGVFTMVCQDGMVECIPAGERTTATTCGEARDGTTAEYLMVMFEPTGEAGKAVAIGGINRIEALLAATVRERRPVGTSEALDRQQRADRLQELLDQALI